MLPEWFLLRISVTTGKNCETEFLRKFSDTLTLSKSGGWADYDNNKVCLTKENPRLRF